MPQVDDAAEAAQQALHDQLMLSDDGRGFDFKAAGQTAIDDAATAVVLAYLKKLLEMGPSEGAIEAGGYALADEKGNPDNPSARGCFRAVVSKLIEDMEKG